MLQLWLIERHGSKPLKFSDMSSLDAVTRLLPAGFYTTFRTYSSRRRVLGLGSHLNRLYRPAHRLGIQPAVDRISLRLQMSLLLSKFPSPEARLRLILATQEEPGTIYVLIEPLKTPPTKAYSMGVKVATTSAWRDHPALKTTGFIENSQAERLKLSTSAIFEGLLIRNGRILEGLSSNFFYISGHTLGTARRGVLGGITRREVLHLAEEQGMSVKNRALSLSQTSIIDEAFLTSSSRGIVPIVAIDRQQIGSGRVGEWTKVLISAYNKDIEQRAELINPG